jgi:transcription antitermination factor NusG
MIRLQAGKFGVQGVVNVNAFPWYALQVRSRHEMSVADHLDGKGYEWFLPQHKCRRKWSDRIKEVETPLFPGYLFCRFNAEERLPILKTPGVIQVVGYNRIPVPVDEEEIRGIRAVVTSGLQNQPWPFFQIGERVRIESGPLAGIEGILTDFRGSRRFVVAITLLQRAVAVEIDSACVTSLRSSKPWNTTKGVPQEKGIAVAV